MKRHLAKGTSGRSPDDGESHIVGEVDDLDTMISPLTLNADNESMEVSAKFPSLASINRPKNSINAREFFITDG